MCKKGYRTYKIIPKQIIKLLTPTVKNAINRASKLAIEKTSDSYIGLGHLISALMNDRQNDVSYKLRNYITYEDIKLYAGFKITAEKSEELLQKTFKISETKLSA